ncbi:MAG: glycoside hydrolase family 30 protein [Verrucomicrobiota bacterium]|jgi:glucosylceramidase
MKRLVPLTLAAIVLTSSAWAQHNTAAVYLTAKDGQQRLAKMEDLNLTDLAQPVEQQQCVFVDPSKRFQTMIGIGGALTDASAETFYKLPKDKQQEILRAYFDRQNGIGYTLGRTSIHSCDFSSESYTYVTNGDTELASFDVAHDLKYRLPFIKEALAAAGKEFSLFISPWSPPGWMKSNNDMLHGGTLLPQYAEAWANYYVKFIQAYEKEGVPIWGLTMQNEPMAVQTWESCIYTAQEERDFVKNHLGPALTKAGLGGKKLMIWDHNRSLMYERAEVALDDPGAAKYIWGVAFHWYVGDNFDNVRRVQEAYPRTHTLFSEGCNGPFDMAQINDWRFGELYGNSIIHDLNNGAVGWTDWNVLLDERGGPNHVGNYCFAPIHGDTRTGQLYYMNAYYYIGHFSKFIRPGAKRVVASATVDRLDTTAFVNRDGQIAVVVMNASNEEQPFYLWINGKAAKTTSPSHSIMTLVL